MNKLKTKDVGTSKNKDNELNLSHEKVVANFPTCSAREFGDNVLLYFSAENQFVLIPNAKLVDGECVSRCKDELKSNNLHG